MGVLPKNCFPGTFCSHVEFLRKTKKCIYLRNGARQNVYDKMFESKGICRVNWQIFPQFFSPASLGSHLEFLRKMKEKSIYFENCVRLRYFDEIFYPRGIRRVNWWLSPKIVFPPLFGGHLEFQHEKQECIYLGMR